MKQKLRQLRRMPAKRHLLSGAVVLGILIFFAAYPTNEERAQLRLKRHIEQRVQLAEALGSSFKESKYPSEVSMFWDGFKQDLKVEYTFEADLQAQAEKVLKQYKPDYGSIVLMDATDGKILALVNYQKDDPDQTSLALRASYPAASVFKIITATAAIDKAGIFPTDRIRFNGGNYTLYRKNVLSDKINKWTRSVSLKEAFARSINTAFGRLSLEYLNPEDINEYANRFMFNQKIPSDLPVETGVAIVPNEKGYALTEVASGFNKMNRMSVVQGAMLAASVINDGRMVVPYVIGRLKNSRDEVVYEAAPVDSGPIMTTSSAAKVQELMEQTILAGTSRGSFRDLTRHRKFRELEMGGKTGHLTGDNPKGRVDWFVGYGADGDRKIAVAAITVNKKYWTVKSAYLGRTMIRKFFEPSIKSKVANVRSNRFDDN